MSKTFDMAEGMAAMGSPDGGLYEPAGGKQRAYDVIPVGAEPKRDRAGEEAGRPCGGRGGAGGRVHGLRATGDKNPNSNRQQIREPERFFQYKNALQDLHVFREETLRQLRRAEIAVWLAIHGCQGKEAARISYDRLVELTGTSRKHVGTAIKDLKGRGLLEIVSKGRFRPNQYGENGLASKYRVYPKPEPRLLAEGIGNQNVAETGQNLNPGLETQSTGRRLADIAD